VAPPRGGAGARTRKESSGRRCTCDEGGGPSRYSWGHFASAPCSRLVSAASAPAMASSPTALLTWNTSPHRTDPKTSCVPPSSLSSRLLRYRWSFPVTKNTVPPPGWLGTALAKSARFATSRPGHPTPPGNLWGEMKTASL